MRIVVHFAADQISEHLHQIAWEVDQGRMFGAGWCLIDGEKCPVPGNNRQGCPCEGDMARCRQSHPVTLGLPPLN